MQHNPIICAIDTNDLDHAKQLVKHVSPHVGAVKLGLEFFVKFGPKGIETIAEQGAPIFLDLKFHDIPNTVAGAVRSAVQMNVFMMTLHACGGEDMMRRAVEAANESVAAVQGNKPIMLGVTVLTSMDQQDLNSCGIESPVDEHVIRLAKLTKQAGMDGLVCSSHELNAVQQACGKDHVTVVPGIRPAGSDVGDQKRIMTPAKAVNEGAHYLVIGRPITQADDPAKAAALIWQSLNNLKA